MPRSITPRTSLDHLKREAKRWLKAWRAGDRDARDRLASAWPASPAEPSLRDVQHALALEYGLPGWTALTGQIAAIAALTGVERVAESLVRAFAADDLEAMQILWEYFGQ